jgi:hypothetical protein
MNLAQALGVFLSFFAYREGPGAKTPYPGPQAAYTALHTDVSPSLLARFHIYASLHPSLTAREAFNIGDDPAGVSWMAVWPRICAYFGLVGAMLCLPVRSDDLAVRCIVRAHRICNIDRPPTADSKPTLRRTPFSLRPAIS